uniref:Uncharacterized protein n=2 Tax=Bursaphelenchus xylophilus TaxID=6326 RepID=A0A1I7SUN3_BURXY
MENEETSDWNRTRSKSCKRKPKCCRIQGPDKREIAKRAIRFVNNLGKVIKYPYNPRRRRELRFSRPNYPTRLGLRKTMECYCYRQPAKPYDPSVFNPYGGIYFFLRKR